MRNCRRWTERVWNITSQGTCLCACMRSIAVGDSWCLAARAAVDPRCCRPAYKSPRIPAVQVTLSTLDHTSQRARCQVPRSSPSPLDFQLALHSVRYSSRVCHRRQPTLFSMIARSNGAPYVVLFPRPVFLLACVAWSLVTKHSWPLPVISMAHLHQNLQAVPRTLGRRTKMSVSSNSLWLTSIKVMQQLLQLQD